MRFLIDAPLSPKTALWLTTQGRDAVHVLSVGMLTAPDEEIVRLAAAEGRIVITMDMDFPRIVALQRLKAPGILLIRLSFATPDHVHERLEAAFRAIPESDLAGSITVLEENRIRLHRLPLR